MSKTVETKIVEMKFDNSQFERNVKTTIGTLGKLKSSLAFDSSAKKSFQNIETESAKVDFKALNKAIETVNKRFSLMGEIGTRVLHNITDRAYEAGSKVVKALTVQGASDGFKEYELKMGSIQTIMNATGSDIQTVNKYLDELNTYSDKTIYSFSDMTQNIGKFANAGVDLKTSVKAIQGISNAAALAGANSEEASRAMYNISQALSSGVMLNIDWKSIENANMATMEFKQALIDTAVECGTLKKTADGMYESLTTDNQGNFSDAFSASSKFRDNLKSQWMTAEVLTKTLGRYSNELDPLGKRAFQAATEVKTFTMMMDATKEAIGSGWAKTWELIFGDFEEAKVLWTSLSEVIGGFVEKTAKARNGILQVWHDDVNGRATFLLGIREAFEAVLHILKPIKQAFKEVFPPITAKHLLKFSVAFEEAMYKIKFSKSTLKAIHDVFKGFFSIIKFGINIIKAFVKATVNSRSGFSKLGKIILTVAGSIGKFVSKIVKIIDKNNVLYRIFTSMYKIIGKLLSPVGKLFKYISESRKIKNASDSFLKFFDTFTKPGADKMKIIKEHLKNFINKIPIAGGLLSKFTGFVKSLFDTLVTKSGIIDKVKNAFKDCKSPLEILGTLFGTAKEKATTFFEIIDTKFNIVDKFKTAVSNCSDPFKTFATLTAGATEKIKEFFANFTEEKTTIIEKTKTVLDNLPNPLKLVAGFATTAADKVKGFFSQFSIESIKNTATSIDILGKIARVFEKISSFAGNAFNITKDILGAIGTSIKQGFSNLKAEDVSKFIQDAAKIMALLFAAKMFKEMRKAFSKAGDAFETLGDSLRKLTGKTDSGKLYEVAKAVALLAASVYAIGSLPTDKIGQASTAIITLGAALIFVGKYINQAGIKDFKKPAASMAVFAAAIGILALAVSKLAGIKEGLWQGVGAVAVLGVVLTLFTKFLPKLRVLETEGKKAKEVTPTMLSLIPLAIAVGILARSVAKLSGIKWKDLQDALAVVAVLGIVVSAMAAVVGRSNLTASAGTGLMLMSVGILVISKAISSIAKTASTYKNDYENVLNTLIIILAGFSLLAVATNKHAKSILALGPSLLLVSAGIGLIALAIRGLAGLDFESQIIPGLMSMCAVLITIGGMVRLMGEGSENMLKVGTGILEISAGMVVLAGAIKILGSMPINVLGQGLIVLAGALVVFGLAAFALTTLGIEVAFEGIGKTMLKFGVGVLALAAALVILSPVCAAIPAVFMAMAVGIVAAVAIILAGIVGLSALIGAALAALVKVVCKVIISSASDIGDAIEALLGVLLKALRASGYLLAQVIVEVLLIILYTLEVNMDKICERVIRLIVRFIYELCEALRRNSKAIMYTLANVLYTIGSFLMQGFQQMLLAAVPWPKKIRNAIEKGFDGADDILKKTLKVEEGERYMKEWGARASKAGGDGIKANIPFVKEQSDNLGNAMRDGVGGGSEGALYDTLGNFTKLSNGIKKIRNPFSTTLKGYKTDIQDSLIFNGGDFADTGFGDYLDEVKEYVPDIDNVTGDIGDTVVENLDVSKETKRDGTRSGDAFDNGLKSKYRNIQASARSIRKGVTGELDKGPVEAKRSGSKLSKDHADSVKQGAAVNASAGRILKDSVTKELKKGPAEAKRSASATSAGHSFEIKKGARGSSLAARHTVDTVVREYNRGRAPVKKIAHYTTEGYNRTIRLSAGSTAGAVRKVVKAALDSAKRFLGIRSPSKEFAKVGKYCIDGFNNSMNSSKKKVSKTSGLAAKSALESFKGKLVISKNDGVFKKNEDAVAKTVKAVAKQINKSDITNPKITPVVNNNSLKKDLKKAKKQVDKFQGTINLANGTSTVHSVNKKVTDATTTDRSVAKNPPSTGLGLDGIKMSKMEADSKMDAYIKEASKKISSQSSSSYKNGYSYDSSSSSSYSSTDTSSITQDHLNALKSFAAANKYTQNNILDQVRKVRQDINKLTSTMAAMKIQLDTGALVGNLVVPIDKALAKQATIRERG